MDVATAPSTPDNASSPPIIRRAFTAPTRLAGIPRESTPIREAREQGAETLFAQDRCRVVSFTCGVKRPTSSESRHNARWEEPVGVLPWASITERTIAAGPLRIYRVLEVAFLNAGTILKPILPKSQCWCVDGESKFVLKASADAYYRIELPITSTEEHQKAKTLKEVLATVLQYEATPCPFKRGFTVDLPEPPATPIRKRPWKPRRPSQPVQEGLKLKDLQDAPMPSAQHDEVAENQQAETGESSQSGITDESSTVSRDSTVATREDLDSTQAADEVGLLPVALFSAGEDKLDELRTPTRPKLLKTGRAITAPPHLSLNIIPTSDPTPTMPISMKQTEESPSVSSSIDSFHSFHSPISPLPPSPPYTNPSSSPLLLPEDDTISLSRTRSHKREISDTTLTNSPHHDWIMTPTPTDCTKSSPPPPQTPTLISDNASQSSEPPLSPITPSPRTQLRRRRTSRQRTPSPLPPSASLYSPQTRLSGHHLTTAILQKTCSLLLGPPVQLVALMLNIARKIANGSYRGFAFGHGAEGRRIPCSWDFSDTEDSAWEEDDFGVPLALAGPARARTRDGKEIGGSWEID